MTTLGVPFQSDSDSTTQSVTYTPWALPLDVIAEVAAVLSKDQMTDIVSRTNLVSLARVSRDIHHATIPHLYHEIGSSMRHFNNLFAPIRSQHRFPKSLVDPDCFPDWPICDWRDLDSIRYPNLTQLIWRFSFTKTIRFKPNRDEDDDHRKLYPKSTNNIRKLQRALQQYNGRPFKLFSSVRHVVIDLSDYHLLGGRAKAPLCQFIRCLQGTIPAESASLCFATDLPFDSTV